MAAPEWKIRPLRRGDRDGAFALLSEAGYEVAPNERANIVAWVCSHPEMEAFLAVDAFDKALGLISLSHRPQLRLGGRGGSLDAFYVAVAARRKGIGTALLQQVLVRTQALGCRRVEITVPRELDIERRLLEKVGFGVLDDLVLKR